MTNTSLSLDTLAKAFFETDELIDKYNAEHKIKKEKDLRLK